MDNHYDVIVAGGRCAGAATAMLLARGGLRVLVIEASRRGTDTLSTHALMPGGVLQLHRWCLLEAVVAAGAPTVRAGQFSYGDDVETVEVAAVGFRHAWEAAARVPVSDGHSCREHCDAAMVYDSGTDADDHW
jgi:2-polyprenyl-6-methoxyphenol hydroxylase-like FAD-dependent oxidoreductase